MAAEPGLLETLGEFDEFEAVVQSLHYGRVDELPLDRNSGHLPSLDALSAMWAVKQVNTMFLEIGSGNSMVAARAAIRFFSSRPPYRAD